MTRALLLAACLGALTFGPGCDGPTIVGTSMAARSLPPLADHWSGANADLAKAAARGDKRGVTEAIEAGADPNAVSRQGMPMVLWPVYANSFEGYLALLEAGADPEARFPAGSEDRADTAVATEMMMRADAKFLNEALVRGADPDAVGSNGEPLVWKAHYADRWDLIRALIEAGGNVDAFNHGERGQTLLRNASAGQFDRAVWYLEQGADPTWKIETAPVGYEDRIGAMPILENIYYYEIDATRFSEGAEQQKRAQDLVRGMGHPPPPRPKRYGG